MVPLGTIIAFVGAADKIPLNDGWLPCDGAELKRKGDYSPLFQVIGTLHGVGDGVDTFNLPDFRGYFLRGVAGKSSADKGLEDRVPMAGNLKNEAGSLQHPATALPKSPFKTKTVGNHSHLDPTWNGQAGPYELATLYRGPGGYDYGPQAAPTGDAGGHDHEVGFGGDTETRPINKYVHWLVKAKQV